MYFLAFGKPTHLALMCLSIQSPKPGQVVSRAAATLRHLAAQRSSLKRAMADEGAVDVLVLALASHPKAS